MKSLLFITLIVFVLGPAAVTPSRAADDLYPPAPPPGSAFVRFAGGESGAQAVLRGRRVEAPAPGRTGAYHAVSEGAARLDFGAARTAHNFRSGTYYTAVLRHGKLSVLEEPAFKNRLKAQIILLNLSDKMSVSLKTGDGKTDVISDVAPGTLAAREVNPVKAGFSVTSGADKIGEIAPRPLERGAGYAVVVFEDAHGTVVFTDKAKVE